MSIAEDSAEQPEGIDETKGSGWGEYPLDSVFVRKEERTVSEVIRRIKARRYQLDPDFQRTFVWAVDKQSKLIESCLMRIPLPVFYVAEAPDGRIIVVDGLQRLTTLQRYMDGSFALSGLATEDQKSSHELEGKRFIDLPLNLQERIEDTQLIFYILDSKAPERARLDIFDRVNSGVPLSRQQMRNSLYNGPATRWLKAAATSRPFLTATGGSLDAKSMRDCEAINRFCAFSILGEKSYRGADMEAFLGHTLQKMNKMSDKELSQLTERFSSAMNFNRELFGPHAFRKSLAELDPSYRRSVINISLFDVCSVVLVPQRNFNAPQKGKIRKALAELLHDDDFRLAITYSTNGTQQVNTRFEMARETFGEILA